jgi:hypothetical protein
MSNKLALQVTISRQRLSIPRLTGLERFMVEVRRHPLPRHGTDHDSKPLPSLFFSEAEIHWIEV